MKSEMDTKKKSFGGRIRRIITSVHRKRLCRFDDGELQSDGKAV